MPPSIAFCACPLTLKRPRPALLSYPRRSLPSCAASPPDPSAKRSASEALSRKVQSSILAAEQGCDMYPLRHTPLPVQLDLLNYHARVASRRRNTRARARRLYRRCVDINSADGRAWLGLAKLHLAEGDVAKARKTFRGGVNSSRKNPHLLQAWGVLEEREGFVDRAKGFYEAAVRADPQHTPSWVALGLWYRRVRNDVVHAREMFRNGVEADPTNYYVWHVLGVLEKDCLQFPVARECFRRGVEANPNNAATYVLWGSLEDSLGNFPIAFELFQKAHVANPRNAHAYVSHAVCAERFGDVEKAISLLETAMEVRPNDPAPRQTLGLVHFRSGKVDLARAQFKAALRIDDKHGPTWHAWARVESALGLFERARELYQEAVWAAPESKHVVKTWHAWASLEMEEGNCRAARRYFAHGLEVDSKSVPLLEGLATVEAMEGNMIQAREYFETCIRLQPSAKATWRLYEDLEREYGSAKRAQLVYERFVVTSKQVDERLVVGKPLPGDYAAGGMWIDALELKPTVSAFDSVRDIDPDQVPFIKPFGREGDAVEKPSEEDASSPAMQSKVTVSRRSTAKKHNRASINLIPSTESDDLQTIARMLPKPVFPENMPFTQTMLN